MLAPEHPSTADHGGGGAVGDGKVGRGLPDDENVPVAAPRPGLRRRQDACVHEEDKARSEHVHVAAEQRQLQ
jgi:hypothetical protein